MAIRFACPSCRQPIEIDNEWAGQSVGCPYCRKVVTAPHTSAWPESQIPVASPVRQPAEPILPPTGYAGHPYPVQPGVGGASWALILSVTSALLCIIGTMAFSYQMQSIVEQKVGRTPSFVEAQRALQEALASGQVPRSPVTMACAIVGGLCGIGGLALAIRTLLWQLPRRGMAIAACIISVAFSCCAGSLLINSLVGSMPRP